MQKIPANYWSGFFLKKLMEISSSRLFMVMVELETSPFRCASVEVT